MLNVVGTKGTLAVTGADLRPRLGLRSTWFSVGVLSLTAPPQRRRLRRTRQAERRRARAAAGGAAALGRGQLDGGRDREADKNGVAQRRWSNPPSPRVTASSSGKVIAASVRVPVAPLVRFYPARRPDQLRGYVRPGSLAGTTVLIQKQQGAALADRRHRRRWGRTATSSPSCSSRPASIAPA